MWAVMATHQSLKLQPAGRCLAEVGCWSSCSPWTWTRCRSRWRRKQKVKFFAAAKYGRWSVPEFRRPCWCRLEWTPSRWTWAKKKGQTSWSGPAQGGPYPILWRKFHGKFTLRLNQSNFFDWSKSRDKFYPIEIQRSINLRKQFSLKDRVQLSMNLKTNKQIYFILPNYSVGLSATNFCED